MHWNMLENASAPMAPLTLVLLLGCWLMNGSGGFLAHGPRWRADAAGSLHLFSPAVLFLQLPERDTGRISSSRSLAALVDHADLLGDEIAACAGLFDRRLQPWRRSSRPRRGGRRSLRRRWRRWPLPGCLGLLPCTFTLPALPLDFRGALCLDLLGTCTGLSCFARTRQSRGITR
ncbi:MAG: hypothetical protein Q8M01_10600 [Rubrivivax sp.]|nr:hypothetical protein [Rubrivivax sp.]